MARRVGVTGGRNYSDMETVQGVMWRLSVEDPDTRIISGGASGADRMCELAAHEIGLGVQMFRANWTEHGRAAGPIRNQEMVDSGLDLLIAFPGGRGTADMVRRARAAGVPVEEVNRG